MFRRALLVLLVMLIPLKAVAAGVVSLIGMPGHTHHAHALDDEALSALAHADHAGCAQQNDAPSTPLHDHACPHLGMVSIAVAAPVIEPQRAVSALNAPPPPHFSSVVHDVPSPIPLGLSAR